MTMNNKLSPQRNKTLFFISFLILCLVALSATAIYSKGQVVTAICVFYAVITTLFLLAQVFAFVVSHAYYSDSIEEPKYKLLELEESEWKGFPS